MTIDCIARALALYCRRNAPAQAPFVCMMLKTGTHANKDTVNYILVVRYLCLAALNPRASSSSGVFTYVGMYSSLPCKYLRSWVQKR